jgi:4-hydroxy-tetrahydrodipicolinate reductase
MSVGERNAKRYRVIQWATGKLGRATVAGIAGHRDLELVAAWVHSQEKEGRDVGELCGIDPLRVRVTRDKDALLSMRADCVCYVPGRQQSANEAVAELSRILRSGKNVVNSHTPALVYSPAMGDGTYEQLQEACLEGKSSLYTGGMDPGWGTLGLAISALTLGSAVRSIRMMEISNYASWNFPHMTTIFGFGQPDTRQALISRRGFLATVWGSTVAIVAEALGSKLDEIVDDYAVIHADEPFDIAVGHIARGTVSGVRFEVRGIVDGEPRVVLEHVTKLRDQDFPEVDFPGSGYRAELDGEPRLRLDLTLSPHDRRVEAVEHAGYVAGAMTLVNAIPAVCDAAPGVLSYLDLRPHPSKNLLRLHS